MMSSWGEHYPPRAGWFAEDAERLLAKARETADEFFVAEAAVAAQLEIAAAIERGNQDR